MKKINALLVGILAFCVAINVRAEKIQIKECEYTKEYIAWLKLSDEEKKNTIMPNVCQNLSSDKYYFIGNSVLDNSVKVTDSKFNLKDYNLVTSVKDQGSTMACWAFATNASIESNLLVNKLGEYDLSEAHMELATQNTYDYGRVTYNRKINAGANYLVSSSYIMNSWGPITESKMPFQKLVDLNDKKIEISSEEVINVKSDIDINSIVFLGNEGSCGESTIKDIKEYLITNGALATSVYLREDIQLSENQFYDGNGYTDLDGNLVASNQSVNHGVTIVGWDDNVSKDSFDVTNKPQNNGAWIIKNSYGEKVFIETLEDFKNLAYETLKEDMNSIGITSPEGITSELVITLIAQMFNVEEKNVIIENGNIYIQVGDNGYQYISYEDVHVCNSVVGYFDAETEVEDNAYYYDTLGPNGAFEIKNTEVYFTTTFSKKYDGNEELKEISIFFQEVNQKYEVYVTNGTIQNFSTATKVAEGTSEFSGYHTIKLSEGFKITDDQFTVIVKMSSDSKVIFAASRKYFDLSLQVYNNVEFVEGVQYMSMDGTQFSDVTKSITPFHFPIKAYTNELEKDVTNQEGNVPENDGNNKNQNQEGNVPENDGNNENQNPEGNVPGNDVENNDNEPPKEDINTDGEIDVELNDFNKNENNSNVDTPIPEDEAPQTGFKSIWLVYSILLGTTGVYFAIKRKNKVYKI